MTIDERHRLALHEAAKETWGPEVAVTLMEMLPATGWAEVATRSDLAVTSRAVERLGDDLRTEMGQLGTDLRREMAELGTELRGEMAGLRTELRGEMGELRAELHVDMADCRTTVERALRTQLMWTVTTLVAGCGVIAAVSAVTR